MRPDRSSASLPPPERVAEAIRRYGFDDTFTAHMIAQGVLCEQMWVTALEAIEMTAAGRGEETFQSRGGTPCAWNEVVKHFSLEPFVDAWQEGVQ